MSTSKRDHKVVNISFFTSKAQAAKLDRFARVRQIGRSEAIRRILDEALEVKK